RRLQAGGVPASAGARDAEAGGRRRQHMSTTGVSGQILGELIEATDAAPSVHGVRHWRMRVSGDTLKLYAEPRPAQSAADPFGRTLHLGCGAALLNLRVAAQYLGREPVVRLLPDPAARTLLAEVRLTGRHKPTAAEARLYD